MAFFAILEKKMQTIWHYYYYTLPLIPIFLYDSTQMDFDTNLRR